MDQRRKALYGVGKDEMEAGTEAGAVRAAAAQLLGPSMCWVENSNAKTEQCLVL